MLNKNCDGLLFPNMFINVPTKITPKLSFLLNMLDLLVQLEIYSI